MGETTCGAPYHQDSATGFHICGGIHRPWPQSACGLCNNGPIYNPITKINVPVPVPASSAFPGTLRDWFAGMALAGLASAHDADGLWTGDGCKSAEAAYKLADAMMQAREEAPK